MRKPKVLIVDDIVEYLEALKRALGEEFEVVTAANIAQAKERLTPDIDILLVDICLDETKPGEDRGGVEVLRWAKQTHPSKPVVMMSAYRDFDAAIEALNLGASKFLKKPIDVVELKELFRDILGKRGE
jgi:DNA-binding NtrC family response regulator